MHVAAQTGNLESLIRLLDAGAGRAPRDRVSSKLVVHGLMAFSPAALDRCTTHTRLG